MIEQKTGHRLDDEIQQSISEAMEAAPPPNFIRPKEHSAILSLGELKRLLDILALDFDYFSDTQINALMAGDWRILFLYGAARGGKTFTGSMIGLIFIYSYITHNLIKPGAEIWLVGNQYRNTVEEYNNLVDWLKALDWLKSSTISERDGVIRLKRCPQCPEKAKCSHRPVTILTRSAQLSQLDNIASTAPALILVCEAAQLAESAFYRLIIRTSQLRAPMIVSGTLDRVSGWYRAVLIRLKSKSEQKRLKAKAFAFSMMDNKYVFPDGDNDPEKDYLEAWLPVDEFENKVLGILAAPSHHVFGKEFDPMIHIGDVQFDPEYEVWLGIDPGYASAYAVVCCQLIRNGDTEQCRVFDEIFLQNTIDMYVIAELKSRWWYPRAKEITPIADPAAKAHPSSASQVEVWKQQTGFPIRTPKKSLIPDQISFLRGFFAENPLTHRSNIIINPKCQGLLSELGHCENPNTRRMGVYSYRLEDDQQIINDHPIDENNHAIKALTYMLISAKSRGQLPTQRKSAKTYQRVGVSARRAGVGRRMRMRA